MRSSLWRNILARTDWASNRRHMCSTWWLCWPFWPQSFWPDGHSGLCLDLIVHTIQQLLTRALVQVVPSLLDVLKKNLTVSMVFGGTNSSTICITVPGSPRTFNGHNVCTIIAPNFHPIFYPLQVDAKRSAQAEARNAAQMQAGVCNKSWRDFGNVCTKSSRGSCSVAASSPGSGASGGRWFGAAMPQAGRATDYCWLRGVVWVVSLAGVVAARERPCIWEGDSWDTSAPALVFDVQWVAWVCVFFAATSLSEGTGCHRVDDAHRIRTRRSAVLQRSREMARPSSPRMDPCLVSCGRGLLAPWLSLMFHSSFILSPNCLNNHPYSSAH